MDHKLKSRTQMYNLLLEEDIPTELPIKKLT